MAFSVSSRERRLWSWTLAVLIAILTSALFAGKLVDVLGSEGLTAISFAVGLLVCAAAAVGIGLGGRSRLEFWVVFGLVGVVAMIPVRAGVPATERSHLFEYGLLAVMIYEALTERRSCGAGVRFPALTAICTASIVGWLDEAVQAFVPGRVYDLRDVGTNALAAVVVVTAVAALRAMRERS